MKKIIVLLLGCLLGIQSFAQEHKTVVFRVDIQDEIGPEVWRLVKKSFDEARKANADYIVIDMNTYGGMVLYADSLRTLILNSKKPVWAFIDNNAASAGALIAIACDKIYMREGANIGAATVVSQQGQVLPDKYQSYMRSMIRSTAQAQGMDTIVNGADTLYKWKRDPQIAEAMVDQSIYIKGISDSGKIVTFTPHEALKYGYCDGMAENIGEVLELEKIDSYTLLDYKPTMLDKLIGWLINPFVQGILILVIVGGIYFELQTPGVGFPLVAALTACVLYFAPLYLEGLANHWEIVLFLAGVILLLLEIFVIPGFGIAGISGIICILFALVMAGIDEVSFEFFNDSFSAILKSLFVVVGSAVVGFILSIWLGGKIFGSPKLAFALHAEQRPEDGYVGVDMAIQKEVGKEGIAATDLRPGGKVMIGDEMYDAVSVQGEYVPKNSLVKVVRYQSGQIYVEVKR